MGKKSSSDQRPAPNKNERTLMIVLVTSFLRHHDESLAGKPHKVPGFEAVIPHLWLTMARGAAVLAAQERRSTPEEKDDDDLTWADLARRWLHNGVLQTYVSDILHPASRILMDLGELEVTQGENPKLTDKERFFEEASVLLADAAKLSPARSDILKDLCQALSVRACAEGADSTALLRDALRHSDEAIGCFTETSRYIPKTKKLHPEYQAALAQGGVLRWLVATKTKGAEEKRGLLEKACLLMRQVFQEKDFNPPEARMIFGQAAHELAWFPEGSPQARRDLFGEACTQFAAVVAADGKDVEAHRQWGSALVGRAALSSGKDLRNSLRKAEEQFEQLVRLEPGESAPWLEAADAWMRLAAEPSAEAAEEGARRAVAAARKANAIEPGSGDYSLACGLSRLGQISEAAESLAAVLARDPSKVTWALEDPDLEPIWVAKPEWRRELAGRA